VADAPLARRIRIMKKLPVDLGELEMVFDTSSPEDSYYLGLETGEIILVMDEAQQYLDEIYDDLYDLDGQEQGDFEELLQAHPMPDWMRDAVREARQVELGLDDRYVDIPTADSDEGYQDMEDFVETIDDDRAYELLSFALDGPRPFRRFKDALANYPDERQRWFDFKSARMRRRVIDWLASLDIEPEGDAGPVSSD
jgi:hypothetical protein